MKYEFITKDEDTSILKYKDKEFSFTKDVALITKLQNINFDARNEMIMDLAKKGMTTDDLIALIELRHKFNPISMARYFH